MKSGLNILIIDPHEKAGRMLGMMIRDSLGEETRVRVAADLNVAKEQIRCRMFDLAFCDLFAPGREGVRTLRIIKGMSSHLPLVALTGPENARYEMRFVSSGAEACLERSKASRRAVSVMIAEVLQKTGEADRQAADERETAMMVAA